MSAKDREILFIANPFGSGGGGSYRAQRGLLYFARKGLRTYFIVPWASIPDLIALESSVKGVSNLMRNGVHPLAASYLPSIVNRKYLLLAALSPLLHRVSTGIRFFSDKHLKPLIVVSYHEGFDAISLALRFSTMYGTPVGVFLQLPPFYERRRWTHILHSHKLFYKYLYRELYPSLFSLSKTALELCMKENKRYIEEVVKRKGCILAVSKSIPMDMGGAGYVSYLDPGVSLDPEDEALIKSIRDTVKERKGIVIFGGRPIPSKGLIEGILAFSKLVRERSDLKLVFTGYIGRQNKARVLAFAEKLGIREKVLFTGYISRKERLRLVRRAMLMLYPSHEDSYSYAVLEATLLGTPVAGYGIPALQTYFGGLDNVRLAPEGDLEGLVQDAMDLIEGRAWRDEADLHVKKWDEILEEELGFWLKCSGEYG